MRALVTGGAGFIGSSLVDRLLAAGHQVTAYDNFSTGQRPFLEPALRQPGFRLAEGDTLDLPALTRAMEGHDFVFHLAANADVRFGTEHPRRDLEQNFKSVLQAGLAKLDLVTRQEFDIQAAVLQRSRERLEALEQRIAALEQPVRK